MIPYGRQQITEDDIQAVAQALRGDFLTQGPIVAEFEKTFADFIGAKYAIAVNNATSALHLCALAMKVGPGQKVLCTPNTFVASSNCVLYCGGDIEFVDIDPQTFCIDLQKLEVKLKTAARGTYSGVIAVDFGGYPLNLKALREITNRYGVWLIEDACHAPGAEFQDEQGKWHRSGNGEFADFATFSFHPVKHLTTGEGGMITTNSKELADKVRTLRTHGITKDPKEMHHNDGGWYLEMQTLGMNYRIPDILCALGLSQLKRLDANLKSRRRLAARYDEALKSLPLKTQPAPDNVRHAYHLYVIQTEKRKALYDFLKSNDIHCQVHYIPIYSQPYYVERYGRMSLPAMENYYSQCLSLPMYHAMTDAEQDFVIAKIREFFGA